jgi:hypothetical protein
MSNDQPPGTIIYEAMRDLDMIAARLVSYAT